MLFKCEHCGKSYSRKNGLQLHITLKHLSVQLEEAPPPNDHSPNQRISSRSASEGACSSPVDIPYHSVANGMDEDPPSPIVPQLPPPKYPRLRILEPEESSAIDDGGP